MMTIEQFPVAIEHSWHELGLCWKRINEERSKNGTQGCCTANETGMREFGSHWVMVGMDSYKEEQGMLVLSRKEGEKLVIGDNITLVVSRISGNRVTVGIEAPVDVKIMRGELADGDQGRCARPGLTRRTATVSIDLDSLASLDLERQAM